MQKEIARLFQAQAMQDVPYLPFGSYMQPAAWTSDITGFAKGLVLFTGVRRT